MSVIDLSAYLSNECSVYDLDYGQVLELRDAATSDMLVCLDTLNGSTDLAPWSQRVLRNEWTEDFAPAWDVVAVDNDMPDHLFRAASEADELDADGAPVWQDYEVSESKRHWNRVRDSYGQDLSEWLADQDDAVLIEEFAPDQPHRLLPERDGGAGAYYVALTELVAQCHDAAAQFEPTWSDIGLPDHELTPEERRWRAPVFDPPEAISEVATAPGIDPPANVRPWARDFQPDVPDRSWRDPMKRPEQDRRFDLPAAAMLARGSEVGTAFRVWEALGADTRRFAEVTRFCAAKSLERGRPGDVLRYVDRAFAAFTP